MVVFVLHFGVLAITLKLVHCLLEELLLILIILLVLLLLLLQEVKLTRPKSFVLFKLSLNIRVHSLDLEVLDLPLLDLLSDSKLTL